MSIRGLWIYMSGTGTCSRCGRSRRVCRSRDLWNRVVRAIAGRLTFTRKGHDDA